MFPITQRHLDSFENSSFVFVSSLLLGWSHGHKSGFNDGIPQNRVTLQALQSSVQAY